MLDFHKLSFIQSIIVSPTMQSTKLSSILKPFAQKLQFLLIIADVFVFARSYLLN